MEDGSLIFLSNQATPAWSVCFHGHANKYFLHSRSKLFSSSRGGEKKKEKRDLRYALSKEGSVHDILLNLGGCFIRHILIICIQIPTVALSFSHHMTRSTKGSFGGRSAAAAAAKKQY